MLYAGRSSNDEQLLIRPFLKKRKEKKKERERGL
jgi:hypothetical protein